MVALSALLAVRLARSVRFRLAGLRLSLWFTLRMRSRLRTMMSARPALVLAARIMPSIIPPVRSAIWTTILSAVAILLLRRW